MAQILAAKSVLEILTNETFDLEAMDEIQDTAESVEYLSKHLRNVKGKLLSLPPNDPKSCFNLISQNYPELLKLQDKSWEDLGGSSHCPLFW
jgi:hypothetical protein